MNTIPQENTNDDQFVNEDLKKGENRINWKLHGLMNIPHFKEWFAKRLKFDLDFVIYPTKNVDGQRPDFVIKTTTDSVHDYIEVKTGLSDKSQIDRYRAEYCKPIYSIVGQRENLRAHDNLSLQEIAEKTKKMFDVFDGQQKEYANGFLELFKEQVLDSSHPLPYGTPEDEIQQLPIMLKFREIIGDKLYFGKPHVKRGKVSVTRKSDDGWTVHVYARGASQNYVALMWGKKQTGVDIRIPSAKRLHNCIPPATALINDYVNIIREIGFDMDVIPEGGNEGVDERQVYGALDRLAPIIRELANVYGG